MSRGCWEFPVFPRGPRQASGFYKKPRRTFWCPAAGVNEVRGWLLIEPIDGNRKTQKNPALGVFSGLICVNDSEESSSELRSDPGIDGGLCRGWGIRDVLCWPGCWESGNHRTAGIINRVLSRGTQGREGSRRGSGKVCQLLGATPYGSGLQQWGNTFVA